MARRGKTVIGKGAKEQSRTMMEAAESGAAEERRGREAVLGQYAAGEAQAARIGAQAGQVVSDVRQQEQQEFAEETETGRQAQTQQKIDLQAAEKGLQPTGEGPTSPLLDRQQRLEQEMAQGAAQATPEQQRLAEQAGKPMEMARARGGFEPTPEAKQAGRVKLGIAESEVKAKITNAAANMMNAKANYARATAQGGEKGSAAAKVANQGMLKSMEVTKGFINKVVNNEVPWANVAKSYAGNPDMEAAAASGDDAAGKSSVVRFLRNQLGYEQVAYMAATGQQPPGWDPDNPITQQFNARFSEVAASFRSLQGEGVVQMPGQDTGMLSAAWRGVTDYDSRTAFLRKTTARIMQEADNLRRQAGGVAKATGVQQVISEQARTIAEQAAQLEEMQRLFGARPQQPGEKETRFGTTETGEPTGPGVQVGVGGPGAEAAGQARAGGGTPGEAIRAGQAAQPTAPSQEPADPRRYGYGGSRGAGGGY